MSKMHVNGTVLDAMTDAAAILSCADELEQLVETKQVELSDETKQKVLTQVKTLRTKAEAITAHITMQQLPGVLMALGAVANVLTAAYRLFGK